MRLYLVLLSFLFFTNRSYTSFFTKLFTSQEPPNQREVSPQRIAENRSRDEMLVLMRKNNFTDLEQGAMITFGYACSFFSNISAEDKIAALLEQSVRVKKTYVERLCFLIIKDLLETRGCGKEDGGQILDYKGKTSFLNIKGLSGKTVLHHLACIPYSSDELEEIIACVADHLIDRGARASLSDNSGQTVLHLAAVNLNEPLLKVLLKTLKNLAPQDSMKNTPLHLALLRADGDGGEHKKKRAQSRIKVCRLIMSHPLATIDLENCNGDTPLHLATQGRYEAVFDELLDFKAGNEPYQKAKVNHQNKRGQTPLHLACSMGMTYFAQKLIEAGARITARDEFGNLPIHYVCSTDCDNSLLREMYSMASTPNSSFWTPLHVACFFEKEGKVRDLLEVYRVDADAIILASGKTALMIACEKGYEGICLLLLTDKYITLDLRDPHIGTALDWACEFERINICVLLLKKGFKGIISTRDRARLLQRAYKKNNTTLAEIFLENLAEVDGKNKTVYEWTIEDDFKEAAYNLEQNFTPEKLGLSKQKMIALKSVRLRDNPIAKK